MPIKKRFGCTPNKPYAPGQWEGALPRLPQFANASSTTDERRKKHRYGWAYAVLGNFSPHALYTGFTDQLPQGGHSSLDIRFWQHYLARFDNSKEGKLHHAMQTHSINCFIIVGIMIAEVQADTDVPPGGIPMHRRAEQLCESHFDALNAGLNTIRVVKHTTHAGNAAQQRWVRDAAKNVDHTATDILLQAWVKSNETFTVQHFQCYRTQKLITHYDYLYKIAVPNSAASRLKDLLCQVIRLRKPTFPEIEDMQTADPLIVVIPYSTAKFESSPVQQILTSYTLRQLVPSNSRLRHCRFQLWFSYSSSHKSTYMNAKQTDTADNNCACDTIAFKAYKDTHHNHILTTDLAMLSKHPQLRDALEKGTAYKPQYAYSSMQWHEIGHWIAANVVKQAQRYDELPKHVYSNWMQAFYEAFIKHTDSIPTTLPEQNQQTSNAIMDTAVRQDNARRLAARQWRELSAYFRFTTVDKAPGSFAILCNKWTKDKIKNTLQSDTYESTDTTAADIGQTVIQ